MKTSTATQKIGSAHLDCMLLTSDDIPHQAKTSTATQKIGSSRSWNKPARLRQRPRHVAIMLAGRTRRTPSWAAPPTCRPARPKRLAGLSLHEQGTSPQSPQSPQSPPARGRTRRPARQCLFAPARSDLSAARFGRHRCTRGSVLPHQGRSEEIRGDQRRSVLAHQGRSGEIRIDQRGSVLAHQGRSEEIRGDQRGSVLAPVPGALPA